MSLIIIFVIGYAIGGISALMLIGLTMAGRKGNAEHTTMELNHEVEQYGI